MSKAIQIFDNANSLQETPPNEKGVYMNNNSFQFLQENTLVPVVNETTKYFGVKDTIDLTALKEEIDEIKKTSKGKEEKVDKLEEKVDKLEEKVDELEEENDYLKKENKKRKNQIKQLIPHVKSKAEEANLLPVLENDDSDGKAPKAIQKGTRKRKRNEDMEQALSGPDNAQSTS